ncbi:MAG TPA: YncE family protein [Polyangiaceae bacterium]|nr:YncE family protein [Polyangiaceae bacterium]
MRPLVSFVLAAAAVALGAPACSDDMEGHGGMNMMGASGHGGGATHGGSGGAGGDHMGASGMGHGGDAGHGGAPSGPPSSTPIAAITYNALFVVNGGDSSVSVINAETNEVAGTVALQNAPYPHHLYLSPDRATMLLAVPGMDLSGGHGSTGGAGGTHGGTHGGGSEAMPGIVMLLDATTGATRATRTLPAMNHNAIFSPDGAEVWTSQMVDPGSVLVLDAATLGDKASIAVQNGPAEVTFSASGAYAFVANTESDSVTVIKAADKTVAKTITVGDAPVGAWQGANGVAYVDNEAGKSLTAIDTTTLEITRTIPLGFTPGMAALGPDGMVWVTDADNGKVSMFMADTGEKHMDIATGAGAHGIAFSGDGKTAYVSNQAGDTVSVIDVAQGASTKTLTVGKAPNGLVWRAK